MNFENQKVTNPEYKAVKGDDVIERATQELVDEALRGAGQDFIERRRPHLVEDTRKKVAKIYEDSKDMFENFSGDVSGDEEMDMINRRAEVLANLFDQRSERVDVSAGGEVLDGEFSEANTVKDAAAAYVMDVAGTDDIEKIDNFGRQLKNAEALIDIFKATDPFSYDKFQRAIISGDLTAAIEELKNFRKRQLGEGGEEVTA
jgi:hypothetical protein